MTVTAIHSSDLRFRRGSARVYQTNYQNVYLVPPSYRHAGYGGLGIWTAGAVGSVSDYYFCAKPSSPAASMCCGCAAVCNQETCPAAAKQARGGMCPPCPEISEAKTAVYAAQMWASVPPARSPAVLSSSKLKQPIV